MKDALLATLEAKGQSHLLRFWDELDDAQRTALAARIEDIDFDQIAAAYAERDKASDVVELAAKAQEPPSFKLGEGSAETSREKAVARGVESLANGEVAVLLVAGGQGTRLGFEHPKGMYPVGPVSNATLFQIHIEKVVALGRKHGVRIPFCVMTSHATNDETIAFLEENDRFGLDADDLFVFQQGVMPAVDEATGKLLLGAKDSPALSPDGHGGTLAALERSGVLSKLEERGVKQLFYFQVDNPLVDIGSAEFLGYHLLSGSELSSEVVRKNDPLDRVGNVVEVDGRLHVIEYSDLPDDVAEKRNDDGSLAIWAGSIAIHVMDLGFLRRMTTTADALPFHIARKKVPFVNEAGETVQPTEPNAIKFEKFIFDLLPNAKNSIVVEVDPRDHFAPLKNAAGAAADTEAHVRAAIADLHRRWLQASGVEVAADATVEIRPLFALDADDLKQKASEIPPINGPTFVE